MKLISWNVNGINALLAKSEAKQFLHDCSADVICLQEMKATREKMPLLLESEGYLQYNSIAEKKGYSGVTTLTKKKPLSIIEGIGIREFDSEGRILTLEFMDFYLVNCYFPNAQPELARIDFKVRFDKALESFVTGLNKKKKVVITGDFNVAHQEIDLKNPKANEKNAGFSLRERAWIDALLKKGWVDTFRMFNSKPDQYTWWSYRFSAREKNIGWRIDYFVVSPDMKRDVKNAEILSSVRGSDHCPITLEL